MKKIITVIAVVVTLAIVGLAQERKCGMTDSLCVISDKFTEEKIIATRFDLATGSSVDFVAVQGKEGVKFFLVLSAASDIANRNNLIGNADKVYMILDSGKPLSFPAVGAKDYKLASAFSFGQTGIDKVETVVALLSREQMDAIAASSKAEFKAGNRMFLAAPLVNVVQASVVLSYVDGNEEAGKLGEVRKITKAVKERGKLVASK